MVWRRRVSASPEVILPPSSTMKTESARLVVNLKSIGSPFQAEDCTLTFLRDPIDNRFEDDVGIDPFRFPFKVHNYAVTQGGQRHVPYILIRNLRAAAEQGPHFAADDQSLRAARTRSVSQILLGLFLS